MIIMQNMITNTKKQIEKIRIIFYNFVLLYVC